MVQTRNKYLDILWFHRWFALTMFVLVVAVALAVSLPQPKFYRVASEIYIEPKPSTVTGESLALSDGDYRQLNNQMEILSSDDVAERAVSLIREELKLNMAKSTLQGSLGIRRKEYTSVISLTLELPAKPKEVRDIMKLYLKAYQDKLTEMSSRKATKEREFLQAELEASQKQLVDAGERLRSFQAENQAYNLDTQVAQMLSVAARMDEQVKGLSADIAAARRHIAMARRQLPASPEYLNLIARIERDPEASDLRKQIVSLEAERAEWASKLTDAHPKMMAYATELKRLQSLLDRRLDAFSKSYPNELPSAGALPTGSNLDFSLAAEVVNNQIKLEALQARESTLAAAQGEVTGMLRDVPEQAVQYVALKNGYEMAQDKVRLLQKRLDEAALMENVSQNFTKVDILKQPTLPGAPVRPDLKRLATVAVLLGMCLALFSVFVRATLDRTLRWPFQVKGLLDDEAENTIFALPALQGKQEVSHLLEKTNFTVPEPYKRLIIHLENLAQSRNVRRIGIIPVSSFEDCNLATVALSLYLTELSNKMVLIDTDYGKGSVTRTLRSLRLPLSAAIEEGPGVSDYLRGEVEDFIDVIYPLGKTVYGSLIPAGDPMHDAGFQFSHRNLSQLEENLSPNYNFVIYSLPAIQQSYDAIAVGRTLDGVILLAQPGMTGLDEIQHAIRELQAVNTPILGMMIQP